MSLIYSQTSFYKQFAGNGYDFGQGIIELPDSSYMITGASSSFLEGPSQMFLLHIDSLGNYIWSNSYGGTETDWGRRVKYIPNDVFFVGGYTNSTGDGAYDFSLWKIDNIGQEIWQKTYGSPAWERALDMAITADSGVLLVGETNNTADGLSDIFFVRTDYDGNLVWQKQITNPGDDRATSIIAFDDSSFVVGGEKFNNSDSLANAWMCRILDDGTILWEKSTQIGNYNTRVADVEVYDTLAYGVGEWTLESETKMFVYKSDIETGDTVFVEDVPNNYYSAVGITNHGNVDLFNVCATYFDPALSYGEDDLFYYGYTFHPFYYTGLASVQYQTQQVFGDITTTYNLGSISVGYNEQIGPGGASIFVIRMGYGQPFISSNDDFTTSPLVSISNLQTDTHDISVYPNPSNDYMMIEMPNNINTTKTFKLMDLYGRLVLQHQSSKNSIKLDVSKLNAGVYFLQIESDSKSYVKKIQIK